MRRRPRFRFSRRSSFSLLASVSAVLVRFVVVVLGLREIVVVETWWLVRCVFCVTQHCQVSPPFCCNFTAEHFGPVAVVCREIWVDCVRNGEHHSLFVGRTRFCNQPLLAVPRCLGVYLLPFFVRGWIFVVLDCYHVVYGSWLLFVGGLFVLDTRGCR